LKKGRAVRLGLAGPRRVRGEAQRGERERAREKLDWTKENGRGKGKAGLSAQKGGEGKEIFKLFWKFNFG
jgi:hypothetical protein